MRAKLILLLFASVALCACASVSAPRGVASAVASAENATDSSADVSSNDGASLPYQVPDGWSVAETHSNESITFYCETGHENDAMTDNFSVEYGTNRYAASEHMQFRDAIMAQLAAQASAYGATLTGDGTTTTAGDALYIFTMDYEGGVGTQYYVVGEKKYAFFHATDFSGGTVAADAARYAAMSFVWD